MKADVPIPFGGCERAARADEHKSGEAIEFISDTHHSISSADCLSVLRDALIGSQGVPTSEQTLWLTQNVDDPEVRQAVITLLAYDSDDV